VTTTSNRRRVPRAEWCSDLAGGRWIVLAIALFAGLAAAPAGMASIGPPTPIAPAGAVSTQTPTYRWSVVPGATWYQVWVNDSTGTVVNQWYTAAAVGAASGECAVTPSIAVAVGDATWWVRAWSSATGNGPWSVGRSFTVCGPVGVDLFWSQIPPVGGSVDLFVSTSGAACPWSISNLDELPAWLSVAPVEGTGDAVISITVEGNPGLARDATLVVGDETFLVSQLGVGPFRGWHFQRSLVAVGGAEYQVVEVFAQFDDPQVYVLNVFNSSIRNDGGTAFHQNDLVTLQEGPGAGAWSVTRSADLPAEGVFSANDSFVLVGGPIGGANATLLDQTFGGGTQAVPPENAGWNALPPYLPQHQVDPITRRLKVAQFVIHGAADDLLHWAANIGYTIGPAPPAAFGYGDGSGRGPGLLVPYTAP